MLTSSGQMTRRFQLPQPFHQQVVRADPSIYPRILQPRMVFSISFYLVTELEAEPPIFFFKTGNKIEPQMQVIVWKITELWIEISLNLKCGLLKIYQNALHPPVISRPGRNLRNLHVEETIFTKLNHVSKHIQHYASQGLFILGTNLIVLK